MFEVSDPSTNSLDRVYSNQNQHLVNKIMSSPVSYDLMGQGGGIVLEAGDSATGVFRWIQVLTDTALASESGETAGNLDSISKLDDVVLPGGVGIGGRFTKVQVTSGLVIAYYY
jgi:hypothetical protein